MSNADPTPTRSEIPDSVNETPLAANRMVLATYGLTMYGSDGDNLQNINLTRQEYVQLKQHVASLRGHVPAATQKESFPVQADDPEARAQKRLRELSTLVIALGVQAMLKPHLESPDLAWLFLRIEHQIADARAELEAAGIVIPETRA